MLYFLLICALLGLLAAVATGIVITRKQPAEGDPHYLLVMGSTVNGTEPSIMLSERIQTACDYLTAHPDVICIPTGGKNPDADIPEAQCIANKLTAMGIEESRIWMEDKATNTRENIRFSLDLIEEKTGRRPEQIGLVSSEYHLYRAGLLARAENITSYGIPARTSWVTLRINYFLREIVAVWYYTLLGGL